MGMCVRSNEITFTSRDSQLFANNVLSSIQQDISLDLNDSFFRALNNRIDLLIVRSFPDDGEGRGLIKKEIAQAVLNLSWTEIVKAAREQNLALKINIETRNEGEANEQFCFEIETRPLTEDEAGTEEDLNTRRPENPFDQPPQLEDLDRPFPDLPPRQPQPLPTIPPSPEPQPRPTPEPQPLPRLPQPDEPPRQPEIPLERADDRFPRFPKPTEPPRQPREDSERKDEEDEEGEEEIIEDPSELSGDDVTDLLRQIRDRISSEADRTRRNNMALTGDILDSLLEIQDDIDSQTVSIITELNRAVDDLAGDITTPIVEGLDSIQETIEAINDGVNQTLNVFPIVDAIDRVNQSIEEDLATPVIDAFRQIDQTAGRIETSIVDSATNLIEQWRDAIDKTNKQLQDNLTGFTDFISDGLTVSEEEIANWICQSLELFKKIVNACNLDRDS